MRASVRGIWPFADEDRNILTSASTRDPQGHRLARASDEQVQQVLGGIDGTSVEVQDHVSY